MAPSPDDARLVALTRDLIRSIPERTDLPYADTIGGCSPLSVCVIARRLGGHILERDLGDLAHEMGLPGYFGPPVIAVNRRSRGPMRWLAYSHGLAHLAAGELDVGEGSDIVFMSDTQDWMTLSERRADLFALANVFDDPTVRAVVDGVPRDSAEAAARYWIKQLAPDWPLRRVVDRARLRLLLYEHRREE